MGAPNGGVTDRSGSLWALASDVLQQRHLHVVQHPLPSKVGVECETIERTEKDSFILHRTQKWGVDLNLCMNSLERDLRNGVQLWHLGAIGVVYILGTV